MFAHVGELNISSKLTRMSLVVAPHFFTDINLEKLSSGTKLCVARKNTFFFSFRSLSFLVIFAAFFKKGIPHEMTTVSMTVSNINSVVNRH